MKKVFCFIFLVHFVSSSVFAGVDVVRSEGITLTGADGVNYIGTDGITLTGADGALAFDSNGITLTGADGLMHRAGDNFTTVGADGVSYLGKNGITLTGADGITLTGADGITLTGADGITLTGADGVEHHADSIVLNQTDGITLTGADGITLTGADGVGITGADGASEAGHDGITLTGADGITLTGADGITLTGADSTAIAGARRVTGFNAEGIAFDLLNQDGITLTGADGITLTGADGVEITQGDGISLRNVDGITLTGADRVGMQSVDPELAIALNGAGENSSLNAVIVFHDAVNQHDVNDLRQIGIAGGIRYRALPMVYVSATRDQIVAASRLAGVRSIYGNRSISFNSDPYFKTTDVSRVGPDADLQARNSGLPVTGRNVAVAVLDTGINGLHGDLTGKVVQNVRVTDSQSSSGGFSPPMRSENITNTDSTSGHGTFVAGVIASSGAASSNGRFNGVAPGAKLVGLSVAVANLSNVLSGLDYVLDRGAAYNVKVVNCSFSANTVFDYDDPVNIATRMLTDRGINVVVSAGNSGPGNGTLNPYAAAPWVIGVGASDQNGVLANFSSRGSFGGGQQPALVAPGINIASIRSTPSISGVGGVGSGDPQRLTPAETPYYTTASGTSFSAPQVSGAVALMLEANPTLTPAQIKDILGRTATPLPRYFQHETGAGMLNTYAAVLESAFPARRMGVFRSTLTQNSTQFTTNTPQDLTALVEPGAAVSADIPLTAGIVQASVGISWALSPNDFGLKLFNEANVQLGESNSVNEPGLTGRHEQVVMRYPAAASLRSSIQHRGASGTAQQVYGAVEVTRVEYPELSDIDGMSPELRAVAERAMLANLILPEGSRLRPNSPVSRYDLAMAFVRAGRVNQYVAGNPLFTDVRDVSARNAIESVQSRFDGKLFYDASPGGSFFPNNSVSRFVAAIAFVKAAGLDNAAGSATLPSTVTDWETIQSPWRGYVAVALQNGYLRLDAGGQFAPNRALTRIEMAQALNILIQ